MRARFQEDGQTFRESLSFISQTRGDNLLATHCLSVLYFYEQLVEGNSYISELGGKEKKSESLGDLFSVFGILRRNYGKVHVNFGDPIHLDSLLQAKAGDWRGQSVDGKPEWLPELVDELATKIMTNI